MWAPRVLDARGSVTDPAFWGGDLTQSPVNVGHNQFHWSSVLGPYYLVIAPAFDRSMILSIRFHMPALTATPSSYSFCISNLTALTQ
jgi:hypothetical protein